MERSGIVQSLMGAFTGGSNGHQRGDNSQLVQERSSFKGGRVKNALAAPRAYATKTVGTSRGNYMGWRDLKISKPHLQGDISQHDIPLPSHDGIKIASSIDAQPESASG
jgi:hypothetical protein